MSIQKTNWNILNCRTPNIRYPFNRIQTACIFWQPSSFVCKKGRSRSSTLHVIALRVYFKQLHALLIASLGVELTLRTGFNQTKLKISNWKQLKTVMTCHNKSSWNSMAWPLLEKNEISKTGQTWMSHICVRFVPRHTGKLLLRVHLVKALSTWRLLERKKYCEILFHVSRWHIENPFNVRVKMICAKRFQKFDCTKSTSKKSNTNVHSNSSINARKLYQNTIKDFV